MIFLFLHFLVYFIYFEKDLREIFTFRTSPGHRTKILRKPPKQPAQKTLLSSLMLRFFISLNENSLPAKSTALIGAQAITGGITPLYNPLIPSLFYNGFECFNKTCVDI